MISAYIRIVYYRWLSRCLIKKCHHNKWFADKRFTNFTDDQQGDIEVELTNRTSLAYYMHVPITYMYCSVSSFSTYNCNPNVHYSCHQSDFKLARILVGYGFNIISHCDFLSIQLLLVL